MTAALAECTIADLQPGRLAEHFADGAAAVVIGGDSRVREAWDLLIDNPEERLPWNASVIDVARNHCGGRDITETIGDIYHFRPGRHVHVARKLELVRRPEDQAVTCTPRAFHQGDGLYVPDADTLELCWQIAERIMQAIKPARVALPAYRVAVQRIRYQEHRQDNQRLCRLAKDALGRWGQIGYAIDRRRETARGMLASRGVCDAFALMGQIPPLRRGLDALNRVCARHARRDALADGAEVVGKAHYDTRFFSALCGTRSNVRTEVLHKDRWVRLPIGQDSLVVFPGMLAKRHFGLPAVLHRILVEETGGEQADGGQGANMTLLFGAK